MAEEALLRPLEALLNRNVAASSRARDLAAELDGRSLELRVSATPLTLRLAVASGHVSARFAGEGEPDAVIEGPPLSLALLAGPQAEERIRDNGVQVSGDAETARGFRELFEAARPDFEEELSRLTGDVAAHHLAGLARDALAFGRRVADTFARNLGEYLAEESRDVPARPELEELLRGIDTVREDTDRLAARLDRITARKAPS